ncbi:MULTISPECIES: hypothetical protein [Thermomonosporaceae]|uniref:hypothetical protein n=1 Tax=Thermomonosporaceae TaxID=2012 RepID=UPI00255AF4B7|nr:MULTISPECIES: hypothetical protein [Thermomonosporaceae]MDL4775799.1 hypothetical protein [Actinomadura xylanilytica]
MDDRTGREAWLAALGAHLAARRFEVELTARGLQVTNPREPGCCESVVMAGDMITCSRRGSDGGRLWFFTSWREPIAPADEIINAAVFIHGYLSRRPGTAGSGR